jgi:predicted S18 family serine protease
LRIRAGLIVILLVLVLLILVLILVQFIDLICDKFIIELRIPVIGVKVDGPLVIFEGRLIIIFSLLYIALRACLAR